MKAKQEVDWFTCVGMLRHMLALYKSAKLIRKKKDLRDINIKCVNLCASINIQVKLPLFYLVMCCVEAKH